MTSITVVMCVYEKDKDEYFSKAINSLIENRNYINKTIIVVNGYISEIKRKKINESMDLLKILKIDLPINIGLSRALNIGLNKVETDWIARFDSDDICLSDRFKKMSQFIMKYGDQYDVIGTYIEEFNDKKKRRRIRRVPLNNKKIKKNLIYSNPMNHVTIFFKKSLLNEYAKDDFYPLIDGFEDYALWFKLIKANKKFINLPEITVLVRADQDMMNRRGGLGYVLGEIKFRKYIFNLINSELYLINLFIGFLRIIVFSLPNNLKDILYRIKRN